VEALTQSVCDLALGFGEGKKDGEKSSQKMSRPFGVSLLMAGYDRREGPQLFFSDPSGTYPSVCKTQHGLLVLPGVSNIVVYSPLSLLFFFFCLSSSLYFTTACFYMRPPHTQTH
jgi:hypothetical protein